MSFLDHKVPPKPQKLPELAKNAKKCQKTSFSVLMGVSVAIKLVVPLDFH